MSGVTLRPAKIGNRFDCADVASRWVERATRPSRMAGRCESSGRGDRRSDADLGYRGIEVYNCICRRPGAVFRSNGGVRHHPRLDEAPMLIVERGSLTLARRAILFAIPCERGQMSVKLSRLCLLVERERRAEARRRQPESSVRLPKMRRAETGT